MPLFVFFQLQYILAGSNALIGIDETRKAERLRVEKKCQHRVLTVMQTSAGTTAFTQSASYGRLWDDIHLSGHFTCRLPTICEFLPSSSRGQNIFLLDANSISQLVDAVNQWMTGSLNHIIMQGYQRNGVFLDFVLRYLSQYMKKNCLFLDA